VCVESVTAGFPLSGFPRPERFDLLRFIFHLTFHANHGHSAGRLALGFLLGISCVFRGPGVSLSLKSLFRL